MRFNNFLKTPSPDIILAVQVARRVAPEDDAAAVLAIRDAVGPHVALRADANRRWSLQQALAFGRAARPAGLQVRPPWLLHLPLCQCPVKLQVCFLMTSGLSSRTRVSVVPA